MLVYIFPIVLCLFGILIYDRYFYKSGNILYYFIVAYLAILAGLSYRVGSDSGFYMDSYTQIPTIDELTVKSLSNSEYQPLYLLLCTFCKYFENEIWLLHLVQSSIVCFSFSYFLRKYSSWKFTGLLLFSLFIYPYFCYEIYKESLAVSCFLLGYPYLQKNKYIKYYIFAFLGIGFHLSAILIFAVPFIQGLKFNYKYLLWLGVATFFYISLLKFVPFLITSEYVIGKVDYYTLSLTKKINENWYIDSSLRNILVPLSVSLWYKFRKQNLTFEWAFCVYVILGCGTLGFALLFERPLNYFLPFIVVALVKIIEQERLSIRHVRMTTFSIVLVFWLAARGLFYIRSEIWRLLIPYESIFTENVNAKRENVVYEIHPH